MAVMRSGASLTRRRFLTTAAAMAAAGGIAKPALSRAADRPVITHGVQSGDVSVDSGIVWARADRASRMLVEVATSESFKDIRSAVAVDALLETDFTAKALLEGLPAGQDVFYRIRFQDHSFPSALGSPQVGHFRTAPSEPRAVSFVWSGDTAGGGWGIDEARGGMRTYSTMLKSRPDFFIHCGDHIYADCPLHAERKLTNGEVWRNIVTEDKSKIAQTLAVFLLDMRSYRTRYGEDGAAAAILGPTQTSWLKRELMSSQATWKVIAADLPIGVVSGDAIAQGDGSPRGREIEIADLLAFIKHAGIGNTVWITADMHYTAAHYYDPNAAVFQDFEPFWEFISGPLHAGTWRPQTLDNTFGPRAVFQKGCSGAQRDDLAPCFGLQFFGHVAIDGASEVMTVTLKDVGDHDLWSTKIEPRMENGPAASRRCEATLVIRGPEWPVG